MLTHARAYGLELHAKLICKAHRLAQRSTRSVGAVLLQGAEGLLDPHHFNRPGVRAGGLARRSGLLSTPPWLLKYDLNQSWWQNLVGVGIGRTFVGGLPGQRFTRPAGSGIADARARRETSRDAMRMSWGRRTAIQIVEPKKSI